MASLLSMTASSMPRVLFLVSLACAAAAVPWAVAVAAERAIHLRLYMHDITGGAGQTAVQVVQGPGATVYPFMPGSRFGDTTVMDDPLTEGPGASSRLLGRAQGTYVLASLAEPVLAVSMTLALTGATGAYNGSTVAVVGRDDVSAAVRELAVVGGTGAFRRATGHVTWRTARMESRDHIVLQLDVYVTVPGASPAPPPRVDETLRLQEA